VGGPAPDAHGNVVMNTGQDNRSIGQLGPFGRVDVNVIQPLWTWGQLDAARDAAQAGVDARTLLVRDTLEQVQLRVVQLYWANALAKRLLKIAGDVEASLAEATQKIAEARANDDASVTAADGYRVALFRSVVAQRKADAQKALDEARIGLAATLAMDPDEIQLTEPAIQGPEGTVEAIPTLLQKAAVQRPDLLALDKAINAREAQVSAAEAARLPQLFAAGTFSYAYAPNRDLQSNPWVIDPFNELTAGLVIGLRQNLAFPLMQAQVEKARAELEALRSQRAGLSRLVQVQVEGARAEAASARTRYAAAKDALTAGKSWFRAASLDFGIGVGETRVLVEAYQGYIESQVGLASAAYDSLVADARLAQTTGTPIAPSSEAPCQLH
jgi:outer membrane protein TolC